MLRFVDSIKTKYRERLLVREEQWPPVRGDKLINLQLVEADKAEGFRGGLPQLAVKEHRVQRTPILYSELFSAREGEKPVRKVLVEGNGGMGKTTLCTMLTEEWAEGKILEQFNCLLLLPFREKSISSAMSLSDLLKVLHGSERIRSSVANEFEDNEGKGVLIIADGWDELEEVKRSKQSFLYNLLFGDVLPLASVLLTSRPSASASLHNLPSVSRLVEVMGFNKKDIEEYIISEFKEPEKATGLLKQLRNNPLIQSVCCVPLNCAITCNLWHTLEQVLPPTLTELYTQIILNVILRDMRKKFPQFVSVLSLSSFDSIPSDLHPYWWRMCEFAFKSLLEDKVVFSQEELSRHFPEAIDSGNKLMCFGLLQSAQSLLPIGHGLSFHFLHLTFQEYLAALHFMTLPPEKQVEICLLHGAKSRFGMVWKFFFGLGCPKAKCDEFPVSTVLPHPEYTVFLQLLSTLSNQCLVLSHCALESKNDDVSSTVAMMCNGCFYPRTPHDCVAVFHVISHIPSYCSLYIYMQGCELDNEQLRGLIEPLRKAEGELQVKELDLDGNNVTNDGIIDLFGKASVAFSSLENLQVKDNDIQESGLDIMFTSLISASCNSITELRLSCNPLGVSGIQVLRNGVLGGILSNLTNLHLSNTLTANAEVNGACLVDLAEALSSHCCSLMCLNLSRNNLGIPGAQAISGALPQLVQYKNHFMLDLSETMLGDEGITAFCNDVSKSCMLSTLVLDGNNIHAEGVLALLDTMSSDVLSLSHLSLCKNPLSPKQALCIIRELSNNNIHLHALSLESCGIVGNTVGTSEGQMEMSSNEESQRVTQNSSIEILTFSGTDLSGESLPLVVELISICQPLRYFSCRNCCLDSKDLKQLLTLLSSKFSQSTSKSAMISAWDLSGNNIDDEGVAVLFKYLTMFPDSVHDLLLDGNPVSNEVKAKLGSSQLWKNQMVSIFSIKNELFLSYSISL